MAENRIRSKLVLRDADAAIALYRESLGAVERVRFEHGGTIVFAEIELRGTVITLKDADEYDPVQEPGPLLDVVDDDPDGTVQALVEAGGTVVFEVSDKPYGARGGRVRDPFGVQWLVQTPVTMSPEEFSRLVEG